MELQRAIGERHSIRSFKKDAVPEDVLLKLADAGQKAPSTSNMQAWRFLFVTDPALKEKVDLFAQGLSGKPPVILVICSDREAALKKGGSNAEEYGCVIDAALAAENIMLSALEYGLGTCLIKSYDEVSVREILRIPEKYRIEMLMSIGYSEGNPRCPVRPEVEKVAFFNQFPEAGKAELDILTAIDDDDVCEELSMGKKALSAEKEVLIYMLTSAKALPGEPPRYGLLRLLESVRRICEIWADGDAKNKVYQDILACIQENEEKEETVKRLLDILMK